jgi:hypothetical protein
MCLAAPLHSGRTHKEGLMRIAIATGLVLISTGWASAQTSSPPDAASPAKTVTISGCVAGSSGAQPFTLANALVLPDAPRPGADSETPSPAPPPVSAIPTEPAGSGTTAASAIIGASGTAGNAIPAAAGTSGSTAKDSNVGTYTLTGTDMTPWAGKRVQVVGTVISAKTAAASASPAAGASTETAAPLELKVQSVQGVAGSCPKP